MTMTLNTSHTLALALALMLGGSSACVVDAEPEQDDMADTDDDDGDDESGDGDSDDQGDGDPDQELGCATAASYSSASEPEAEQLVDEEGDTYIELYAELDTEPLNELEISLWDGAGVFEEEDLGPGTYLIEGSETNYDDCGVCVVIYADVDPATDLERQVLMAQSGTVQIDSTSGTMSGSLEDVVLVEVNPATSTPVAGGCRTTIPSLDFEAPML